MSQPVFDRRAVLRRLGAVAPLLALGRARLIEPAAARTDARVTSTRVVVIGAGVAGLAAARALQDSGAEVVVVEAKPHIGGRLVTDRSLGAAFEVGAGWIHGPNGNPVSALARQARAATFATDDYSTALFDRDGTAVPMAELERLVGDYEALLHRVDDLDGPSDMPLAEAMRRVAPRALDDPRIRWAATAFTEFDTGGPIEALSAANFDEDDAFAGADVILPGGYDQILPPLADGLDIRLNTRVTRIAHGGADGVRVDAGGSVVAADYAVCTLPLGVLKHGGVTFEPALPDGHRRSIARIPMGNVTKVALRFPRVFWPRDVQYFGYASEPKGRWPFVLNYLTFADAAILMPLSFGAYAGVVEQLSDADIAADVMQTLSAMFGRGIPAPEAMLVTRWSKDPETYGVYSYTGVGTTPGDFTRLAKPVGGRLLLAGEHTNFDYHGTVHGALISGRAAAERIGDLAD